MAGERGAAASPARSWKAPGGCGGISRVISDGAPGRDGRLGAGEGRAQARRRPGHGRGRRGMLQRFGEPRGRGGANRARLSDQDLRTSSRLSGERRKFRARGTTERPQVPGPAAARGKPRKAMAEGRGPAAPRSPSMSLVTVLKCIFCGRAAGRAGALRPPLRSSSAPFPACSAAAATEIREAILKAFALGDRGLFSSIGETPMRQQPPRQPPTTSPPARPSLPSFLPHHPGRCERDPPPSRRGAGGKLKKKKKEERNSTKTPQTNKKKPTKNKNPTPTLPPSPPGKGAGEHGVSPGPSAQCRAPQRPHGALRERGAGIDGNPTVLFPGAAVSLHSISFPAVY